MQMRAEDIAAMQKEAENGNGEAMFHFGNHLLKGNDEEKKLAVGYFQKAIDKGFHHAHQSLATCLMTPIGVTKDVIKGLEHLKIAAEKTDNTGALDMYIGNIYRNGFAEVKPDPQLAFKFFQSAAAKKNQEGILAAGECYEYGMGVQRNFLTAMSLYQSANSQNIFVSRKKLAAFNFTSTINYDSVTQGQRIYDGTYSFVYRAKIAGREVVMKRPTCTSHGIYAALQEASVLQSMIPHQNIVEYVGVIQEPFYIVTKFTPNGSLLDFVENNKITWGQCFQLVEGFAAGLTHLHDEAKRIHCDLKATNLLVDEKNEVKITDLGTSLSMRSAPQYDPIDSIIWMSPERLKTRQVHAYSDMWSFAIVLCEMVTDIFPDDTDEQIAAKIPRMISDESARPTLPANCPTLFRNYINSFLVEADKRPTAKQALAGIKEIISKNLPEAKEYVRAKLG